MLTGLKVFQGLVILLMLVVSVVFFMTGAYLQGVLYLAFGALFLGYMLTSRKQKQEKKI